MLIHAAVAEPYNRIVWRELHAWAFLNQNRDQLYLCRDSSSTKRWAAIRAPPPGVEHPRDLAAVWDAYPHGKNEEKLKKDRESAEQVDSNTALVLLLRLYHAGLPEPYVLFSLGDTGISRDYPSYRLRNRENFAHM